MCLYLTTKLSISTLSFGSVIDDAVVEGTALATCLLPDGRIVNENLIGNQSKCGGLFLAMTLCNKNIFTLFFLFFASS